MRPKGHSWVLIQHFIIQQQPSGRKVFCFQLGAFFLLYQRFAFSFLEDYSYENAIFEPFGIFVTMGQKENKKIHL